MKMSFMTFACPKWSFDQVIDAAARHGYQCIEFRCNAGHAHGVEVHTDSETRRRMREELRSAAIEVCCLATDLQIAQAHTQRDVVPYLQLARDIGAPAIRVLCGLPS